MSHPFTALSSWRVLMANNSGASVMVDSLVKTFEKSARAPDGVSFEMPAGTVLGLLGLSGAAKTTTVQVLTTLLRPDSGSAYVAGIDVLRDPAGAPSDQTGRPVRGGR
jgi:ABC-type multidrug transport system ATPase subunit